MKARTASAGCGGCRRGYQIPIGCSREVVVVALSRERESVRARAAATSTAQLQESLAVQRALGSRGSLLAE